jgi:Ca2+-binding RTX toxin-like protein
MTVNITLSSSTRLLDEDANNTGHIIAFDGEAGPNVVNPDVLGSKQITITDDLANFAGGSLSVSTISGGMNQLRLRIAGSTGVFSVATTANVDGSGYNVTYFSDAQYTGTDVLVGGATVKAGSNITPGSSSVVIGTVDATQHGGHGATLLIHLNTNATAAVVQALAAHISISVTETGNNNATEDWAAAAGTKTVQFSLTDSAGATPVMATRPVNVASHPDPIAFSPVDGGKGVAVGTNIELTFSENIQKGTGNIVLKSNGVPVETFDVATSAKVTINGAILTINPTADLDYLGSYVVEIPATAINNMAGTPKSYSGTTSYHFTSGPAFNVAAIDAGAPITGFAYLDLAIDSLKAAAAATYLGSVGALDGSGTGHIGDLYDDNQDGIPNRVLLTPFTSNAAGTQVSYGLNYSSSVTGQPPDGLTLLSGTGNDLAGKLNYNANGQIVGLYLPVSAGVTGAEPGTGANSAPTWGAYTPPGLVFAPGQQVALDFTVQASDVQNDTISYKAVAGRMVGSGVSAVFTPTAGLADIPLTAASGHLTGTVTVPTGASTGAYVMRLYADDNLSDANLGTALDVPFQVSAGSSGPNTINGTGGSDSLTGTSAIDLILAGAGDDTITGAAGNDTIQGATGDDSIDGGDGTDMARYAGNLANFTLTRTTEGGVSVITVVDTTVGGEGTDRLVGIEKLSFADKMLNLSTQFVVPQGSMQAAMNSIVGTSFDDTISADALHDANSATSYRDFIDAGGGNDTVHAGQGGDQISSGSGNDLIDGGEDTTIARLNSALTETWSLQNQVQFSGPAARYVISQLTDTNGSITGSNGTVYYTVADGRPGAPDGTDTLYNVDAINFTDKWNVRLTPDVMFNKMLTPGSGQTQLLGLNATGTDFDDVIVPPSSPPVGTYDFSGSDNLKGGTGNDTLYGGAGADTLRGDLGNDRLDGGANRAADSTSTWDPNGSNGVDVADFSGNAARYSIQFKHADGSAATGYDAAGTVLVSDSKAKGGDGQDTLSNIEVLRFSDGEKNLAVISSPMLNWMWDPNTNTNTSTVTGMNWKGTDWNDSIDGRASNVAANVQAGAGNDSIMTGGGVDTIDAGAGDDTVDGGANVAGGNGMGNNMDVVRYDAAQSRFAITLSDDGSFTVADKLTPEFGGFGTDTLTHIERLQFSDGSKDLLVNFQAPVGNPPNVNSLNNIQGTDFGDRIDATVLAGNSPITTADWIQPGAGDDVVYAGAGGDRIQDGAGNDFYDGGANGTSGNSWTDQDVLQFTGAQKRYAVDVLAYADAPTSVKALITAKYSGASLPDNVVRVTDKLPGGDGVNYLINVEQIQFSDGQVNLGVSVNPWTAPQGGGQIYGVGSNNYKGGILNDLIDAAGHDAASTSNVVDGFSSNRDWIDGGLGNDTLLGGAGGDQLQGAKGNDVLDGGANGSSGNVWDDMDRAIYTNSINRYDIAFYRPTKAGEAAQFDSMGLTTGTKAYVASGYYAADGFMVVTDRYSDTMGGDGRDVLRNIEQFQFSDAGDTLAVQYNDNTTTQNVWGPLPAATGIGSGEVVTDTWGWIQTTVTNRSAWGTRFGDLITGSTSANNFLQGNAGNDSITGGDLRDEFTGGAGNDTIDGGANPAVDPTRPWDTWSTYDVARFDAQQAQFKIDRLTDDVSGTVTGHANKVYYRVEHLIPATLGGLGTDIVFDVERLQFSDGDIQLDVKVEKNTINGVDQAMYKGTIFADSITGTAGNDNFMGDAGNDTIRAGAGDDNIGGGAGDDSLYGDDGNDRFVNLSSGADSVDGGAGTDSAAYEDILARYSVELVRGGTSIASFNTSTGFGAGVTFSASTDTLRVTDHLLSSHGGEGVDTLSSVENIQFNDGVITLVSGAYLFNAQSYTPQTKLTGTDADDMLQSGAGNDTLVGGNDTASLGTNFWGGGDVAQYFGAPRARFDIARNSDGSFKVIDIASITAPAFQGNGHLDPACYDSPDEVSAVIGYGIDTLSGIERIQFSDGELNLAPLDVVNTYTSYLNGNQQSPYQVTRHNITGTFMDDLLVGSTSGDQIDGRAGNDTIDGGVETAISGNPWEVQDVVRYEGSRERYTIKGVLVDIAGTGASKTYTIVDSALATSSAVFGIQITDVLPDANGGSGTDLLVNVERVEFAAGTSSTGSNSIVIKPEYNYFNGSLNARGTDFADALNGTAFNDWLTGNAGNDTLIGGAGGDDLEGGAGDDLILGGSNGAADQWGNARTDTARYSAAFERFEIGSVMVDLDGNGSKETSALQVRDLLPSDDSSSLGTDTLAGVETLSFNNRWVDVGVRRSAWSDGMGRVNANAEGTVFDDVIYGDRDSAGNPATAQRDQIRGNAGNDVLIGVGSGDDLQGGEGNDVIDGGANGSTGDAWQDQDQARFLGNSSQYTIQAIAISTQNGVSTILADGQQIASFDNTALTVTGSGLATGVADALQLAYKNLNLADGQHGSGYLVVDSLASDLGGEGVDLVFNVESLWFANGPLEVDIRANVNDWNGDGKLDWVNVTGTANGDSVNLVRLVALTGKSEEQLTATRMDVDLRAGDDVYVGGSGGDAVRTGTGNDYVDGGANVGTDQSGATMRDEVRFEGNFSRYNLIDVALANSAGSWTLSSAALGLTTASTTLTTLPDALAVLVKADLNAAIASMIANAGSQTSVNGWLVADRLPAAFQGTGVDALVNVEALAFSDKWLPLDMQVFYQRNGAQVLSAFVDGTQGNDTIGYSASAAAGAYNYGGDDNLKGNEGNDSIYGGAGSDMITGGAGNDVIDGGTNGSVDATGNTRIDTAQYRGEFARYTITANANGSVTVADSQADGDGTDTVSNVEGLSFSDRYLRLGVETWVNKDPKTSKVIDIQVNGSMLAETIDVSADAYTGVRHVLRGNEGDDTLVGGSGPDEFDGGPGDDSIVGGANGTDIWGNPGFDVARYQGAYSRYTIEYGTDGASWSSTNPGGSDVLVRVTDSFSADDGGVGVDILSGIEALAFFDRFLMLQASRTVQDLNGDGRPDNSELTGTEAADTLTGDVTNDFIKGGGGNDTISGGAGGDILNGGTGDDSLDGGADGVDQQGKPLIDVAQYIGAASLYTVTNNGTSFTVSSSAEGTDTLTHIEGLQFSDRFVNLVQVINQQDLNKDGVIDLIEIRGLDLASAGDTIAPASGNEAVAHRIAGGDGNDTLTGGSATDVFDGGAGNDSITGGGGTDRAVFSGSFANYAVSGTGTVTVTDNRSGSPNGTDTLNGIEELAFSDKVVKLGAADVVSTREVDSDGNQKADTAYTTGTDGADNIDRSASTLINFIDAGAGNDSLTGGSGADTFYPGVGTDTVVGGANDGLDGAGNPNVDRVIFTGAKADYSIKTLQGASFSVSGVVEVGDVVSIVVGDVTVSYTAATGVDTLAELKTGLDTAIAAAKTAGTLSSTLVVTSALSHSDTQIDYTVKSTDSLAAVSAAVANGTHAVAGGFTVSGDNQSGSSLVVASATSLAAGMYLSYSVVTGSGASAVTTQYGPYQIASISGNTLTLDQSLGASPATNATLTVTQDNTDTTLAVGAVSYDRWFEVLSGSGQSLETDTLRQVEQLVFSDGVTDLSFKSGQKADFGGSGLATVIQIQGTDLADVMRSSSANEVFSGGLGADHFVLADGSGIDEIRDFVAGSDGDRITLVLGAGDSDGLNGTGVNTATLALARASQQGSDVMIDLGAGNSIKLVGVSVDVLLAANFEVTNTF